MDTEKSEIIGSRRTRAPNYSKDDIELLFNVAQTYKLVIENKKTDGVTWREKEAAWDHISKAFNAQSVMNVFRSKESLRKLYDNKKKELRKKVAAANFESYKTGGGKNEVRIDNESELILSMVNEKTVNALHNPCDSDQGLITEDVDFNHDFEDNESANHHIPSHPNQASSVIQETNLLSSDIENESIDWGDYKVSHLKTKINSKLSTGPAVLKNIQVKPTIDNSFFLKDHTNEDKERTHWHGRRRPIITNLHPSHISKQYPDLGNIKMELAVAEIALLKRKQEHLEELHVLKIKSLKRESEQKEEMHRLVIASIKKSMEDGRSPKVIQ